jgi:hypothetical protein
VSRRSGRLFEGEAATVSPSNSITSRDGVARASSCAPPPQGPAEVGPLSEFGVDGFLRNRNVWLRIENHDELRVLTYKFLSALAARFRLANPAPPENDRVEWGDNGAKFRGGSCIEDLALPERWCLAYFLFSLARSSSSSSCSTRNSSRDSDRRRWSSSPSRLSISLSVTSVSSILVTSSLEVMGVSGSA